METSTPLLIIYMSKIKHLKPDVQNLWRFLKITFQHYVIKSRELLEARILVFSSFNIQEKFSKLSIYAPALPNTGTTLSTKILKISKQFNMKNVKKKNQMEILRFLFLMRMPFKMFFNYVTI